VSDLKDRFEKFVKTLDGFESIDQLLDGCDPHGKGRADYLFWNRSIIVEQKVLEVDPNEKPQKFINELLEQRSIIAYGRLPIQHIFSKLPDGESLNRKLHYNLTSGIDKLFSNADKQTRDTREIFSIPEAGGVLVILNENAVTLTPEMIGHKLAQMFKKTSEDGSVRYPNNTVAILISELHQLVINHPTKFHPIITVLGINWQNNLVVEYFARTLSEKWAAFNGVPYVQGEYSGEQTFVPSKK
jgi:hypothetical protein